MIMTDWKKTEQMRIKKEAESQPEPDHKLTDETDVRKTEDEWQDEHIQMWSDPDKKDAHPSVQNGKLRERKKAYGWLGPNALLIILLVSSVQRQHEFRESKKLVVDRHIEHRNVGNRQFFWNISW